MPDRPMEPGGATPGDHVDPDPTRNVLDLVRAAIQRQDDLRIADAKLFNNQLAGLRDWIGAKLDGISHEFELVENRRQEQKIDTKTAVDAALSAAEKAVREQAAASEKSIIKSETAAAEQSRQNAQTFSASLKGVTDTLADTKDRVGKMESQAQGRTENRSDTRSNVGVILLAVGASISFVMMVLAVALFIAK